VDARDLGVPVEHDLVARPPADRDPLAARLQVDDRLFVVDVAVDEERGPPPLGGDAVAQLLKGGDVGVEWALWHG
jgi:hypothetical protein